MSNFLNGLKGIALHPVNEAKWMLNETKNVGKPLLKGDFSEAFDQFKGTFGRHQDMMSNTITVPLLGDNKVSNNSDAIAGAIIGSIFAAPLMAGQAGSTTGGLSTAANGTAGSMAGSAGQSVYAPTAALGKAGTMTATQTPLATTGAGLGQAGTSASTSGMQASNFIRMANQLQQQQQAREEEMRKQEEMRRQLEAQSKAGLGGRRQMNFQNWQSAQYQPPQQKINFENMLEQMRNR